MKAEEIAAVPLFAALARDELERVASVSRPLHLSAREVVVNEGEFAFDFYALTAGAADVMRAGERIATLGAGDVFGEMGLVPPGDRARATRRRNASVVATGPSVAMRSPARITSAAPAVRA